MNKEKAMEWVARLRSGKYKQGKSVLNRNDEFFCCLGVLSEIAFEDNIVTKTKGLRNMIYYNTCFGGLPNIIKEKYEMKSEGIFCNTQDQNCSLAYMNDNLVKSFDEIADYIEANWEKL